MAHISEVAGEKTKIPVGQLSQFSPHELTNSLPNVEVNFNCKTCHFTSHTLADVIAHMVDGKCSNSDQVEAFVGTAETEDASAPTAVEAPKNETQKTTASVSTSTQAGRRRPGRPRKRPLEAGTEGSYTPPAALTRMVQKDTALEKPTKVPKMLPAKGLASPPANLNPYAKRSTRISTGALQRRSIHEILGTRIKTEEEEEIGEEEKVEAVISPPGVETPKRKRGRPPKSKPVESEQAVVDADEVVQDIVAKASEEILGPPEIPSGGTFASARAEEENAPMSQESAGNGVEKPNLPQGSGPENFPIKVEVVVSESAGGTTEPAHVNTYDANAMNELSQEESTDDAVPENAEEAQSDEDIDDGEDDEDESYKPPSLNYAKPQVTSPTYKVRYSQIPKLFNCKQCIRRSFVTKEEYDIHMSCHIREDSLRFMCTECEYMATNWNRILGHLLTHPNLAEKLMNTECTKNIIGQYKCPVCKKGFSRKNNMKGHIRKVHHKVNRQCEICGKKMNGVDDKTYNRHVERCKGIEHKCPHCKYRTVISSNMMKHMRLHTGGYYECDICHKKFPTKQRMQAHRVIHDMNRRTSVCEVCGRPFYSDDAVRKHVIRVHTEASVIYKCPECDFTAKMDADLKKHIHNVHNKKYRCELCPYTTNSELAFDQHKQYHNPDRRYPCPHDRCYYRSTTPKQLSFHVSSVHENTTKHQCPICQNWYKKKTHLARHLVTHTDDRPYSCHDCDLTFISHSTYYRHRRVTGHDKNREGIVSVPQNITIQYVSADTDIQFDDGSGQVVQAVVNGSQEAAQILEQLKQAPVTVGDGGDSKQEVQLYEIIQEGEIGDTMETADQQQLLMQIAQATKGMETTTQGMSDDSGEVTYVLKMEDGTEVPAVVSDVFDNVIEGKPDPEVEQQQSQPQQPQQCEEQELEQMEGIVYEEAEGGEVQAMVEVTPPSGSSGNQYAILIMPSGAETVTTTTSTTVNNISDALPEEAALSMLQLQQGNMGPPTI